MAGTLDWETCPRCGQETLLVDMDSRAMTTSAHCTHCGYTDAGPETVSEIWFELPAYPSDAIVCLLCRLPETEGERAEECTCW